MVEEDRAVFGNTLAQVCSDMFKETPGFGELLGPDRAAFLPAAIETIVASIGLAGHEFRGALIIQATPSFFVLSYPPSLKRKVVSDANMVDWAGEIANQLLGRIKNRLGSHGLDFAISTPTVVRGDNLTLNAPVVSSVQHALKISDARADVVFHIAHDAGKPLLPADGPAVIASLEGEALLF